MRTSFALLASLVLASDTFARSTDRRQTPETVPGVDASQDLGTINWNDYEYPSTGWAYVQATIGASTIDSQYNTNFYTADQAVGFISSYHFAHPDESSGADQADFFYNNGGSWSNSGGELPGAVALLANPDGDTCYGLSPSDMVSWILDFANTYQSLTSFPSYPMIYTNTSWWVECTGNSDAIAQYCPLWIQDYSSYGLGPLPAGWSSPLIWQFAGPEVSGQGNQDVWEGGYGDIEGFSEDGYTGYQDPATQG